MTESIVEEIKKAAEKYCTDNETLAVSEVAYHWETKAFIAGAVQFYNLGMADNKKRIAELESALRKVEEWYRSNFTRSQERYSTHPMTVIAYEALNPKEVTRPSPEVGAVMATVPVLQEDW